MRNAVILVLLALSPVAGSIPKTLPVQGALTTTAGLAAPDGSYGATFTLYAGSDATAPAVFTESFASVLVVDGHFSVSLGTVNPAANPLPPAIFAAHESLEVGVAVEGGAELPRQPLGAVPWAFHALTSAGLQCTACVGAGHLAGDALAGYAKTADLQAYAKTADLQAYAKTADLEAYAKTADLQAYAKTADLEAYAKTADLEAYAKTADLEAYAKSADLAPFAKTADLQAYAKSSDLVAYAKLADLAPFAKSTDLAAYAKAGQLPLWKSVEVTLAGGATTELVHGGDTLDVLVSAYVKEAGLWQQAASSSATDLGADPAHLIHWSFDGCSSADQTGHGFDGVDVGTWTCVAGQLGQGYQHPGVAFTNVRHTLTVATAQLAKTHTISMWVKRATHDDSYILYSLDDGGNRYLLSVTQDGSLQLTASGTTSFGGAGTVPLDTWVHVATTYDGATVRGYVNGVAVGAAGLSSLAVGVGNCFLLGEDADGNCVGGSDKDVFKGVFDEVHLFSRALSAEEVTRLAANSLAARSLVEITLLDSKRVGVKNAAGRTLDLRLVVLAHPD